MEPQTIVSALIIGLIVFFVVKHILEEEGILKKKVTPPSYYKDFGMGPVPTGRPRKERGH